MRVAVAVVDRGGDPIQQDRMDGAAAGGVGRRAGGRHRRRAASASPASEVAARYGGPALGAVLTPPVLGVAGGVPVHDGGRVVGGLGVGGADPARLRRARRARPLAP